MFSVDFRLTNRKIVFGIILFIVTTVLVVILRFNFLGKNPQNTIVCSSNDEVREYLESFGLELGEGTSDSITVPYEFNEVYTNYNKIQLSQGFDLAEYKGKTISRFTFEVLNHPAGEDIFAEVLICNKTIIGADLYSVVVDGFISPLK